MGDAKFSNTSCIFQSQCTCCLKNEQAAEIKVFLGEEEEEAAKGRRSCCRSGLHPEMPLPLGKRVAILSFFAVIHSVNCSHSCKKN